MATKKPTGLSISRSGSNLTLSWKRGKKYNKKEQFEHKLGKKGKWSSATDLGKGATSKAYTIPLDSYYPSKTTKLTEVSFRVRGKTDKKWSGWSDKTFEIKIPGKPSLSANPDETKSNICSFSWSFETSDKDKHVFVDIEYQSMLIADCNTKDGSELSWKTSQKGWMSGTGSASGSKSITEDTDAVAKGSHTRWFRVRARGPAGASDWRYAKRVYAEPFEAVITKTSSTITPSGGLQIYSQWTSSSNPANPTDTMVTQYTKAVPEAGLKCPSNASWTDITSSGRKNSTNAISASVDGTLEKDQCLFVRVNTVHLDKTTYGVPAAAMKGELKDPVITNVNINQSTHRATVTAVNNSEVPDSFLVILYRTSSEPSKSAVVGIIPHDQTSTTVQCPDWSKETGFTFGVYAAIGSFKKTDRTDGVSSYSVDVVMRSAGEIWSGGSVPSAPGKVTAGQTDTPGTVKVTWDWSWNDANVAVLSWADHEDAWQSTDEPSEYTVSNIHASEWNISGLETGKRWYVRVRLGAVDGDNTTYGPWSEACIVDLTAEPAVPALMLSAGVITQNDSVTVSWTYVSGDGTMQAYAEVCEAVIGSSGVTYGRVVGHTETAQHLTLDAGELGWLNDHTYHLCVRVVSASGRASGKWSDPVPVRVAKPLTADIANTNLADMTVTEDGVIRSIKALTEMPLAVTVTGAGAGGFTSVVIERAEDYHVERPDETDFNGFEGETIAVVNQTGEGQITFTRDSLSGPLDDGAKYRLIATVKDGLGQSDTRTIEFEPRWSHQALMPQAEVRMEGTAAVIKPLKPAGAAVGDTVDIYRLSADRPELIVKGADFGKEYVDPYPSIGDYGGHRVVFISKDGDYITESNDLAWIDLGMDDGDLLDLRHGLIDFDGEQARIFYDVTQSNTWEKDFKETVYLGGSVQGDWNKGVRMRSNISMSTVTVKDMDAMRTLRKLGAHPGICHIRTLDGSSYACDIQVSGTRNYGTDTFRAEYTLSVTRVDPDGFEGMTYEAWRDE